MRIYLAARYGRREELLDYRADLEERGHVVTSRWLLGGHQAAELEVEEEGGPNRVPEIAYRFAAEDLDDLIGIDMLVSFTEVPRSSTSRGGRHVEFGWALAFNHLFGTPRLVVVGPRENVFHCTPGIVVHADWPTFLADFDLAERIRQEHP